MNQENDFSQDETMNQDDAVQNVPQQAPVVFQVRSTHLFVIGALLLGFVAGYFTYGFINEPQPVVAAYENVARPNAATANTPPAVAPNVQETATAATTATSAPDPRSFVDDDPAFGPEDAPITIVEFSDFECPFCKKFRDETFERLISEYEGKIRFVYRDLPLTSLHPRAQVAAEVGECAHEQGKFWLMHDLLFANQNVWKQAGNPFDHFTQYAQELQMDVESFKDCLREGRFTAEVQADAQTAINYNITGTPAFLINGKLLSGAVPFEMFKEVLDRELWALTPE